MFQRKVGLVTALAGAVFISLMTLLPHPGQEPLVRATPFACLICGELGGVDVLLNVILFLPLGLGLGLLGLPWPLALAAGLAGSGLVELLQMKVVAGRDASLSDLLTNTLGTVAGAALARTWRSWLLPGRRLALALAIGWGSIWLGLATATGAGLAPAPTNAAWYGQWAPDLGHLDEFRGEVHSAEAGGAPLPPGRRNDTPAWVARLTADSFTVAAIARLGPAPTRLAPIVSVYDADQREILLLGQWGDDLVYRVRMAPNRLRLRNPAVRLPGALDLPPGTEVRAEAGTVNRRYLLRVERPDGPRERVLTFSPQWTWAALLPYEYAFGAEAGLLTALWLAALALPLGWWARRGGGTGVVLALFVAVLSVAGVRAVLGFDPAPVGEWLGTAAGLAAGLALAGLNKPASGR
jgi:hypothetical protein